MLLYFFPLFRGGNGLLQEDGKSAVGPAGIQGQCLTYATPPTACSRGTGSILWVGVWTMAGQAGVGLPVGSGLAASEKSSSL